ncbi:MULTISPECIES: LacI family DNA-binding transcriptional regulator [unclassified Fusibacter]|uniref:LacI family DNA-binding transcriptional regulator n=1 Tax=unclassified Fusibacter TaxID=2624464 RepID=UPI00101375AD|nr:MULTISPECIES: LacI family DNA-binding transcriptional regulator [unclassified Fusibacter]MCK8061005.1 LacI family transcriptional regulator [Fusibacter sp. A2]NPE20541.1 LacI family transcriptional regulator [Fusibacter sp. A1]RXV63739.1 LacI family transcriptional regulator [Fusibacter sp. A1]
MSITIKDVAKKANVSISTVSRVINGSKPVSEDIKKRVFEVIEELGYSPNPVARNLVMKKSKLIGVMIPDISSTFVGELLNAVEEIAKTYGYDIILCNSYGELKQEIRYFELFKSKQVEGIIFITRKINEIHKDIIKALNLPIVMINRDGSELDVLSVSIDQAKACYDMTNYLVTLGHTDIALIRTGDDHESFGVDQVKGYRNALEENKIEFNPARVFEGYFSLEETYKIVDSLIKEGDKPSAIFAASDEMAVGAINAIVDNGLSVPEDISVAGSYDSRISRIYRPKITTIKHPIYDIGAIAVRLIIKKINGQEPKDKLIIMPYEIIIRDSTKRI